MVGVRRFGSGPPVLALHGFTLTGEQFAAAGPALRRTVIAPDLPGHGTNADASTDLGDVIESILTPVEGPMPVIGYSQGGRLALLTAVDHPDTVSALVLVSATAGIQEATDRASRARRDIELASELSKTTIEEFIDTWTSAGITSTRNLSKELRYTDRAIRCGNSPQGLARALTGYGQGAQPSVWHRLKDLPMPVLVMSGGRDGRYTTIARKLVSAIPDAELVTIEAAGHNPLLDNPDHAYVAISEFLDRHG